VRGGEVAVGHDKLPQWRAQQDWEGRRLEQGRTAGAHLEELLNVIIAATLEGGQHRLQHLDWL